MAQLKHLVPLWWCAIHAVLMYTEGVKRAFQCYHLKLLQGLLLGIRPGTTLDTSLYTLMHHMAVWTANSNPALTWHATLHWTAVGY